VGKMGKRADGFKMVSCPGRPTGQLVHCAPALGRLGLSAEVELVQS